jgi:hypothetical protein
VLPAENFPAGQLAHDAGVVPVNGVNPDPAGQLQTIDVVTGVMGVVIVIPEGVVHVPPAWGGVEILYVSTLNPAVHAVVRV